MGPSGDRGRTNVLSRRGLVDVRSFRPGRCAAGTGHARAGRTNVLSRSGSLGAVVGRAPCHAAPIRAVLGCRWNERSVLWWVGSGGLRLDRAVPRLRWNERSVLLGWVCSVGRIWFVGAGVALGGTNVLSCWVSLLGGVGPGSWVPGAGHCGERSVLWWGGSRGAEAGSCRAAPQAPIERTFCLAGGLGPDGLGLDHGCRSHALRRTNAF